jgi:putative ATPase
VYMAFNEAKALARKTSDAPVPMHLRNAPTSLMKELGHGDGYRYAHNEPNAFAAGESYFPESLKGTRLYNPNDRGLEKALKAKREFLDTLNARSHNKR